MIVDSSCGVSFKILKDDDFLEDKLYEYEGSGYWFELPEGKIILEDLKEALDKLEKLNQ
jgi:hypothetical protein